MDNFLIFSNVVSSGVCSSWNVKYVPLCEVFPLDSDKNIVFESGTAK